MTTPAPTPNPPEDEAVAPAQARAHIKRLEDENKALRAENQAFADTVMNSAFSTAGIDISKGLGKTMRAAYEGQPVADEIKTWAQENYEWQPPAPPQAPTPGQQLGEQIATSQQRIEAATGDAQPANPTDIDAQIIEAERAGNFVLSMNLKSQKLLALIQSK